jgi:hypothetical protein
MNLNGPDHDVMLCLIEHANSKSGVCFPSEELIAAWTNRPLRTIERSIKSISDQKLVRIVRRKNKSGTVSNRYFINWQPLFAAYAAQKVAGPHPSKVAGRYPSKVADKPMKGEPRK